MFNVRDMSFIDIAKNRYTTKKYDPSRKIEDTTIEKLKEILWLSPSSINSQPWKFTFVSDEEVKSELAKYSYSNVDKVNAASHVVVFSVLEDPEAFEEKRLSLLSEGATSYYRNKFKGQSESEINTWMSRQVYISLGFFLSACASMGIDSTPMEGIQNEEYDRVLGDEGFKTLFAVTIGYRDKEDTNQPQVTPKFRFATDEIIRTI